MASINLHPSQRLLQTENSMTGGAHMGEALSTQS